MSLSVPLNVERKQSSAPLILFERSIRRSATALRRGLEFWFLARSLPEYLGHHGGHSDGKRVERVESQDENKAVIKYLEKGDTDRKQ